METETEFSFLDMIIYCLKRWVIITVIAVVVAASFFLYNIIPASKVYNFYQIELKFCSLDIFAQQNVPSNEVTPINEIYRSTAARAVNAMSSNIVKAKFSEDEQVDEKYKKFTVDETGNVTSLGIILKNSDVSLNVLIKVGKKDDAEKAKAALKAFARIAKEQAYEDNPSLNDYSYEAIIYNENPILLPQNEKIGKFEYLKKFIIGLVVGLVCGVLVVVVIYLADSRLKSFNQLEGKGGILLRKTNNDDFSAADVNNAISYLKDDKILNIMSPGSDNFNTKFSKAIAEEFAKLNQKTLFVNLTEFGGRDSFSEYMKGAKIDEAALKENGYSMICAGSNNSWSSLIGNKDKFLKLKDSFDKIIVSYSEDNNGGFITVSDVCQKRIYILDQHNTKAKPFIAMITSGEAYEKTIGTIIHNAI